MWQQNTVDTFTSPEHGFLGHLLSIEPVYDYPAVQPLAKKTFDVSKVEKLPQVEIFYGYQGTHEWLCRAVSCETDGTTMQALTGTSRTPRSPRERKD